MQNFKTQIRNYSLFTLLTLFSLNSFSSIEIKDSQIITNSKYTRIIIESSSKINNDQILVHDPSRLFIDLKGVSFKKNLKNLAELNDYPDLSSRNILGLKVTEFTSNITRIIINLKNFARVKSFSLPSNKIYQDRFIIDIYSEENKDFLAAHKDNKLNIEKKLSLIAFEKNKYERDIEVKKLKKTGPALIKCPLIASLYEKSIDKCMSNETFENITEDQEGKVVGYIEGCADNFYNKEVCLNPIYEEKLITRANEIKWEIENSCLDMASEVRSEISGKIYTNCYKSERNRNLLKTIYKYNQY